MKRQVPLLLSIALILSFAQPAVAAIKQGATCTTVGKTATVGSNKFKCVKSGKKSVWKRADAGNVLTPIKEPISETATVITTIGEPARNLDPNLMRQGRLCTIGTGDVIGYNSKGKFVVLFCNSWDSYWAVKDPKDSSVIVDPETGKIISGELPVQKENPTATVPAAALKYPKVGDKCLFDRLQAYRFSLIPGYTSTNQLKWIACNSNNVYVPGLEIDVDEATLNPVIPTGKVKASDMKSYDDVATKIQNYINSIDVKPNSSGVSIQYFIEPGEYGEYLPMLKQDISNVMNFYDSIGIAKFMSKNIKFFVGRTNSGIDSLIKANCRRDGYSIPGGTYSSICDDGESGLMAVNINANVQGSMGYDQNADLTTVAKTREMILYYRWAVIHELYHHFQLGIWRSNNLGSHDPVPWIVEGSAQTIPMLFLAKDHGKENSYQYLWEVIQIANLVPPGQGPENGPTGCTNPASTMAWNTEDARRQCPYTQGMLVVETYVARYGMAKFIELLTTQNQSNLSNFAGVFKSVTGDDLATFYAAADQHARNVGYQVRS